MVPIRLDDLVRLYTEVLVMVTTCGKTKQGVVMLAKLPLLDCPPL